MTHPFVTVIIPVFNDAKRLKLCLKALEKQTYQKDFYEIIVIDNGSDPSEGIENVTDQFENAIATAELAPGAYAARNTGISLAKGDIIAFTDADCIPAPDWIEKGVEHLLKTPNCGLVVGKVETFFKDPNQLTTVELYASIMDLPQKEFLEKHQYGATANVFTLRNVIETVGVFDGTLKSSGDVEWGQRIFAHGYKQIYADDAFVHHPARRSLKQLYKRTVRDAGGYYDLQNRRVTSSFKRNLIFLKELALSLVPPLMFVVSAFLDTRLKGIDQKLKVSLIMFFIRYAVAGELIRLKLGGTSTQD